MLPFDMGLAGMSAFFNPSQFSTIMSGMGIAPGMAASNGGGFSLSPEPALMAQDNPFLGPTAAMPGTMPPGAMGNPMSGLQGVQAPKPVQPIMSGGVSGGGQPAPVPKAAPSGSTAIQQMVMSQLMGRRGAGPVPGLGGFVGR